LCVSLKILFHGLAPFRMLVKPLTGLGFAEGGEELLHPLIDVFILCEGLLLGGRHVVLSLLHEFIKEI
jgi:hypothetical protein